MWTPKILSPKAIGFLILGSTELVTENWSGADGRLYVNESVAQFSGRAISFTVGADGGLSDSHHFKHSYQSCEPAVVYPDNNKLGPSGNFFIGEDGGGSIPEFMPDGKLKNKHLMPPAAASNLMYLQRCTG